jgi:RimJ/RimL family protein N-acetyltransferase
VTSDAELLTPRLRLRPWRPDDEAAMAAINRDPEVARFLNRPVDEAAIAAFHGVVVTHWERHGFGFFALESREPQLRGRFLGFAGVAHPDFFPALAARPELGWRLDRAAWGRGLATEAAGAARDDAFARLGLPELISIVHPENVRSRRVAAKLGMAVEGQVHNPVLDRAVDVWRLSAPAGG